MFFLQHNPYLFKLMPDPIEEAKTVAYVLDTRSIYNRIGKLKFFIFLFHRIFLKL